MIFSKKLILIFSLLICLTGITQVAPGATCAQAGCSIAGSYTSASGQPSMGTFSCLGSTPNPNWLAIGIANSGSVHLMLTQTSNATGALIDVDFALYGPYTSVSAGCPIGPGTPTVDCSFSGSATEFVDIPNAIAGQVYILLVTNFNGQVGTINLQPSPNTPSTGTLNCAINFSATMSQTSAVCGQPTGTATATPVGGYPPYTYSWNDPANQTTQTATGLTNGQYTVTITSSPNPTTGQAVIPTTANVTVFNVNPNYSGTTTPASCAGTNNGTATANFVLGGAIGAGVTATYSWNDPANQTTQTATGLSPGAYSCTVTLSNGCVGTVNVNVGIINPMLTTITAQTDATCYTIEDGTATLSVTQGTAPYSYAWTGSTSTTNTATNLAAGVSILTVTDANGCTVTQPVTINQPDPLQISLLSPDIQICREDSTVLTVQGTGGSSAYTFTWFENGLQIGTGQNITVNPDNSGTEYCVVLSEACGSPTVDSCLTITFPTDIIPSILPDKYQACQPATFVYTNNSNNPDEIATTYLSFGNGLDTLVLGAATTSSTYEIASQYSIDVIVVSIYGCIYTNSFPDLVEAIAIPSANFIISPNPTTIFETTVAMQNSSDVSIVDWQWYSPGSVPAYSSVENPTFNFPEGEVAEYEIMLIGSTLDGCVDTVFKTLTVNSDIVFYAPNAFTPDGDEFNQNWEFIVDGIDRTNFNLQIYNRWGQIIWETNNPDVGWDGTYLGEIVPSGVYIWKASVKDIFTDRKKEYQGAINVIK